SRFDFKGANARFERNDYTVTLIAPNDFQLKQMLEILSLKLSKRGIDVACMEPGDPEIAIHEARQSVTLKHGLDSTLSKKIIRQIKDSKLKVQASIQGDKIRVT